MPDLKNIYILLVEDDQFNRQILGQLFQIMDIKHDEAVDGVQAIEMAREKDYDLILMDISMPVMDGYEATRKIRELPGYRDKPIIALTADICGKVNKEVSSGLFTAINIKPIDLEQLQERMIEIANRGSIE